MNYCTIPFSIVMNYCRIPLHRHHGPIQYYIPSLPMNRFNIPFRRYYELLRHHNPIKITLILRRYKTNWLFDRREDHGGFRYTHCSYHSNILSNKMGNSLLAVRKINHKYIVAGTNYIQIHITYLHHTKV